MVHSFRSLTEAQPCGREHSMERILTYQIGRPEHGLAVKQFLKSKGYSGQSIIALKKQPENVLLDGRPVFMNHRLTEGASLRIRILEEASSQHIVPVELPLDIIYEDNDLMIVNKAPGMPVHPSANNRHNTLGNALAYYFAQQDIPFVFRCVNRLDRDTSGLTIIAKHMVSAGILSSMVSEKGTHGIRREYLAIVRGQVHPSAGTIDAPLSRKPGSIIERTVDSLHGESAVTHYRVLKEANGHSLVSLILETGRTHQIRIHMKHLGYPLVGDYLYNPDMEYISRQALHSYKTTFPHPLTGQKMEFTAPLPKDMANILRL